MIRCENCNEEIQNHEAGRCLDRLIAEKSGLNVWVVEGGTVVDSTQQLKGGTPCLKDGIYTCESMFRFGDHSKPLLHYSTDLNHAMEFVKFVCAKLNKLRSTHSIGYISHQLHTYTNHQVSAFKFDWRIVGDIVKSEKNEDEAPLAICISGLKTLAYIEKMKGEK